MSAYSFDETCGCGAEFHWRGGFHHYGERAATVWREGHRHADPTALGVEGEAGLGSRERGIGHESDPGAQSGLGDHRNDEGRSGALRWLGCRCGHPNADHWDGGECAHNGCMCGATYDDEETP